MSAYPCVQPYNSTLDCSTLQWLGDTTGLRLGQVDSDYLMGHQANLAHVLGQNIEKLGSTNELK